MADLSEWQTLLALQAGAAATLTGLVFVAVSINLSNIINVAGLPGRAAESILQLLQVFFICTAALIPRQSVVALAWEILCIAAVSWIAQTVAQVRYARFRRGHPRRWLLSRVVPTQAATIPFCIAACGLWIGMNGAIYWIVPGFFFSFAASVLSAWVLLIEILR